MQSFSILFALLLGVTAISIEAVGQGIDRGTGDSEMNASEWTDSLLCDAGAIAEGELCSTDVNGGPEGAGFGTLSANSTICGNFWADDGARDVDYFHYTITNPLGEVVTWTAFADPIDYYIMIMNDAATAFYEYSIGVAGAKNVIQLYLGPGTYTIRITPNYDPANSYGFGCGTNPKDVVDGNWRYKLSMANRVVKALDDCEAAVEIADGTAAWSLAGSTPGSNAYGRGDNIWYEFVAPSTGIAQVIMTVNEPVTDHIYIAASQACDESPFAVAGSFLHPRHDTNSFYLELPSIKGQSRIIEIGKYSQAGTFYTGHLTIVLSPLPPLTDDSASVQPSTDSSYYTKLWAESKAAWEALDEGRLAFKPVDTMKQGAEKKVRARMSLDSLAGLTEGFDGVPTVERLATSGFMRATLVGDSDEFEIEEPSEADQTILGEYTEWVWVVTPLESGEKKLYLTVTARLPLSNGKEELKDLPVKEVVILVEGDCLWWARNLLAEYWWSILILLILPFVRRVHNRLRDWVRHRKRRPPGFK